MKLFYLTCFFVFLVVSVRGALKDGVIKETYADSSKVNDKASGNANEVKIYQDILKHKRLEQTASIQKFASMKENSQKQRVIEQLTKLLFDVLTDARKAFEAAKYEFVPRQFPLDEELRSHLGSIIENTAMACEMALFYPNKFHEIVDNNKELRDTLLWAYNLSLLFDVYDVPTQKMLHLAGQELDFIPREEGYENPYAKTLSREELQIKIMEEANAKREAKKLQQKSQSRKKNAGPKSEL